MKKETKYKKKLVLKPQVRSFINRTLITIIVFIIGMILVKQNNNYKNYLIKNVYEKNINFTKIKKVYQKYFGNLLSINEFIKEDESVFSEKLNYKKASTYKDGVKLDVSKNLLVPVLNSGIVVFMGEKEGYGNTVIVEQVDGIDVCYSNIKTNNIKLYDYIEKGKVLGEVTGDKLYLIFQKDGKILNYKDYI